MSISTPFIERPIATLAADGRRVSGRPGRLYAAAGGAPAPGRLPDSGGVGIAARRQPETMASSVAQPARIPVRRNSRRLADDLDQRARFDPGHAAIRSDRNIDAAAQDVQTAIDAAGGQLPKNLPSPPTYRKVNPADSAVLIYSVHSDTLPITTVDDYAENVISPADFADPGCRAGADRRPAEAGSARPDRPGQDRRPRHSARRRRKRHHDRDDRRAQGLDQRQYPQLRHL